MKTLACKDLGMDCDFVAVGESAEEVSRQAMEHAQIAHGDLLKVITANPVQMAEMQQAMAKAIK